MCFMVDETTQGVDTANWRRCHLPIPDGVGRHAPATRHPALMGTRHWAPGRTTGQGPQDLQGGNGAIPTG